MAQKKKSSCAFHKMSSAASHCLSTSSGKKGVTRRQTREFKCMRDESHACEPDDRVSKLKCRVSFSVKLFVPDELIPPSPPPPPKRLVPTLVPSLEMTEAPWSDAPINPDMCSAKDNNHWRLCLGPQGSIGSGRWVNCALVMWSRLCLAGVLTTKMTLWMLSAYNWGWTLPFLEHFFPSVHDSTWFQRTSIECLDCS